MSHIQASFGALRALLARPKRGHGWSGELLELLREARDASADEYEDLLLPYLQGADLPSPLRLLLSLEDLEDVAALLPSAFFGLSIDDRGTLDVRKLIRSPCAKQLTVLIVDQQQMIQTEGAKALAESPHMAQLDEQRTP